MGEDPMLPEPVAQALGGYRASLAEHGMSWGEPPIPYVRLMSLSRFVTEEAFFRAAFTRVRSELPDVPPAEHGTRVLDLDFDEVLRDALGGDPPGGLAVLRLTPSGPELTGSPVTVLDGWPVPLALLLDNTGPGDTEVRVAGRTVRLRPGGARLLDVDTATEVTADGVRVGLGALTRHAPSARLRLRAGFPCRWSVWSEDGQGWYPPGAPPRRDHHGTPYFHGDDLLLDVPARPLTVRVTRGMEYGIAETTVTPVPRDGAEAGGATPAGEAPGPWAPGGTPAGDGETLVELTPERLYDAASAGWYGADLHVHLNFAGDVVATPAMAAAMQHGEDLHVLNLLAANVAGDRVFDREALEHWAGEDLPWSDGTHVARMGFEYRNDLLGHLHAFGASAPPSRYHSGFAGAPDWPPSGTVCEELRRHGAVIGYAHAFKTPVETPEQIIGNGARQCTARMAVVDAALGLVDGMEVLHYASAEGSSAVYRRLLGGGNRLAAVAGTDSMLSFTRQRMEMVSSPLGWERTYARVHGPLTAAAYAEAVRRGRTFATTGPFLRLTVDGAEPGDTIEPQPGDRVRITVHSVGPEVERLVVRTADGVLAEGPPGELTAELVVRAPTYIVAVADGGPHPRSLFTGVHAHTSPVYVDVRRRRVARTEDVRWCLDWLDRLEKLIRDHARLPMLTQLDDHLSYVDEARRVYLSRLAH
ncbi:CehA/McbA family metallohydrolase [Sphaerisporangium sp. B11E5]|uniref:CehA/McbA family metallohydrolase n=1 Tax=Sphaerisporangium sp. B11E5 TaxID=3153563 RepID=UPI00325D1E76